MNEADYMVAVDITNELVSELIRAGTIHHPCFRSYAEALGVIYEEYRELETELMKKSHDKVRMHKEATHLGAMCVKLMLGLYNDTLS